MRREDWSERLCCTVAWHQARAFEWGVTDCGTLFADCVEAMIGHDLLAELRGYSADMGALRKLKATGFDSCKAYVEARFEKCPPALAQRGDLIFVEPRITHPLMSPCVLMGSVMVTRTEFDWLILPRSLARTAHKVN